MSISMFFYTFAILIILLGKLSFHFITNNLIFHTMKKIKVCIIIALSVFAKLAFAQSDSLQVFRFVYELQDANYKNRTYNDLLNLDITADGKSLFYSVYRISDAEIINEGGSVEEMIAKMASTKKGALYKILTSRADGELTYITTSPDNFYYKEKLPNIDWKIADGDTMTVNGYLCKKAVANYGGRQWTVWFAEELSLPYGPWKLNGLPGLIMVAHDADNYFKFSCVGIEQTRTAPWNMSTKDYVKCTNAELQKQLRLQAADPVNYSLRQKGLPTISASDFIVVSNRNGKDSEGLPKIERTYMEKMPEDKE